MGLRMPTVKRAASGAYVARKGIPRDVRDAYARLYGKRWEEARHFDPRLFPSEARRQVANWLAEIEGRIATLREGTRGNGRGLDHRDAHGLSGVWFAWFLDLHEREPGKPEVWADLLLDHMLIRLYHLPPDAAGLPSDELRALLGELKDNPEVQEAMHAFIAENGLVERFLVEKRITLAPAARERFLAAVEGQFIAAACRLRRAAEGDFTDDDWASRFPPFELEKGAGLTPLALFDAWCAERQPKPSTVGRWRCVFRHLEDYFPGRDAGSLTVQDALGWKDALVTPERSGKVVAKVWIKAARTVFAWCARNRKTASNPFKEVKVAYAEKPRTRESRAFTAAEAATILRATLATPAPGINARLAAIRRWAPWLMAYSGARVSEVMQLRAQDVAQEAGVWTIRFTPAAGPLIKNNRVRVVPLHEHLVEMGFPEFVEHAGPGPLFVRSTSAKAVRRAGQELAAWVRALGITHPEVAPNHGWRHLYKQIAGDDAVNIPKKMHDAITGHAPKGEADKYGRPPLAQLATWMARFPRYKID